MGSTHDIFEVTGHAQGHSPRIDVLRWQDERPAAAVLTRAFASDPLVTAICQDTVAGRQRRMYWSFRLSLRSHVLAGQPAWAARDDTGAVTGVVLVNRPRTQLSPQVASATLPFALWCLLCVGWRAWTRGTAAAHTIAAHAPPEPFTYLRTLGVDREQQRRGVGSHLVEQAVCTAPSSAPIYLETAKRDNLLFYARHGFHCLGEFPCLEVPVWRLIRPAAVV